MNRPPSDRATRLILPLVGMLCVGLLIGGMIGRRTAPAMANRGESETTRRHPGLPAVAAVPTGSPVEAPGNAPSPMRAEWADGAKGALAIEQRARTSPADALAQVAQEKNIARRRALRHAALRGWATHAPDEALAWAMTLTERDNRDALIAVLQGAVERPSDALRITKTLCERDPQGAEDYGQALLAALAEHGAYDTAAQFALTGSPGQRDAWLNTAFANWGEHDPAAAVASARSSADANARSAALQGAYAGWAVADSAGLADAALSFTDRDEKRTALAHALLTWVDDDPGGASRWLESRESDPVFDAGMVGVATLPALVENRPDVAAGWAAAINDSAARASALRQVAAAWSRRDSAAAERYASNSLTTPQDRAAWDDGLRELSDSARQTGGSAEPGRPQR